MPTVSPSYREPPLQFTTRRMLVGVTLCALLTYCLGRGVILLGVLAVAAAVQGTICWLLFTAADRLAAHGHGLSSLAVFCAGLAVCSLFAFFVFMAILFGLLLALVIGFGGTPV